MTIIVYRSGTMAADSCVTAGDRKSGIVTKIVTDKHGGMAAAAGTLATCHLFKEWFERSVSKPFIPPADDAGFGAIMVKADGTVMRMDHHGTVYPAPQADYHIEGCGEEIAAGALEAGATAEEAVGIACRLHAYCGGPVQVERLKVEAGDESA